MKINDRFELVTDNSMNYILKETYKTKVGTMAVKERYYGTMTEALKDCLRIGIVESDLEDVKHIINEMYRLEKEIVTAVKREGGK